jgi:hypothetical protein
VCAGLKFYSVSQAEASEGLDVLAHVRPDLIILAPALPDIGRSPPDHTIVVKCPGHCAVD